MPAWSAPRPSSRAEHSMPLRPHAPHLAAARSPSRRADRADRGERHEVADRDVERAAHDLRAPRRRRRRRSTSWILSAPRWGGSRGSRATTTPSSPSPTWSCSSTAMPRSLRRRRARRRRRRSARTRATRTAGPSSGHPRGIRTGPGSGRRRRTSSRRSAHAVAHRGEPVEAEAEREARPLLGVEAAVAQHVRVDHAAPAELQPRRRRDAGCRTRRTAR